MPGSDDGSLALRETVTDYSSAGSTDAPGKPSQPQATRLGRYILLEELGRGGMGVVFAAYDPLLDRRVALKLIRFEASGGHRDSLRSRLFHEAQALARLNHPNVVAVFDTGHDGDDTYIAMEFVRGTTLREWLRTGRSFDEILDVFGDAGQGLLAAHAAGLVHRDFKPSNVLIGEDGRVRVSDFGVAYFDHDAKATADGEQPLESSPLPLTVGGSIVGTPDYMAPEQLDGRTADNRSDQFAFCVAFYEALTGRQPFELATAPKPSDPNVKTLLAHHLAARNRDLVTLARDPAIPSWLHAILERGLHLEPAKRFGDMAELLAGIDSARRRPRRRRLVIAGVLLAAAVAAGVLLVPRRSAVCENLDDAFAATFGEPQHQSIKRAFAATGRPYAATTADAVLADLDERARAIGAMRTSSCRATRVQGGQSEAMLDRRTACLDRRSQELVQLATVFASADGTTVDRARDAVRDLPAVAACGDRELLEQVTPLPAAPAVRARIADVEREIARANALSSSGNPRAAEPIAKTAITAAEPIGFSPLLVAALTASAGIDIELGHHQAADATIARALELAAAARDSAAEAKLWVMLAVLRSKVQNRPKEALAIELSARTASIHAGDPLDLRLRLAVAVAVAHHDLTDYAAARSVASAALALGEAKLDANDVALAPIHKVLARIADATRDYAGSLAHAQRGLDIARTLGDEHPTVGTAWNLVGNAHRELERYPEAIAAFEQAITIAERVYGADHQELAITLTNLASTLRRAGRAEDALVAANRALAIDRRDFGDQSTQAGYSFNQVARILRDLKRYEEALDYHQQAVAAFTAGAGADHPFVGTSLIGVGRASTELGRIDLTITAWERALAIQDQRPEFCEQPQETRILLAGPLWQRGRGDDRRRAHELVMKARDALGRCPLADAKEGLAAADKFLAEHPLP
jgi:tetratricopeptide (TPR) repeat protein